MTARRVLKLAADAPYRALVGVGGIGTGIFFALEGDHTVGRNESRSGRLLDVRDYCKLHIIAHYFSVLTGGDPSGRAIRVLPVGKVGDDGRGARLVEEMRDAGMDVSLVEKTPDAPTLFSVCFQYPDGSGGNITTSEAAASRLTAADVDKAQGFMAENAGRFIALAAPEAPLEARRRLLELAAKHDGLKAAAFASAEIPAALQMGMLPLVEVLAVNEDEAAAIVGREFTAAKVESFLEMCGKVLAGFNPSMRVALSVGKGGVYGFEGGLWRHTPAAEVEVASTAGAGDALLAGVLAGLAAGMPFLTPGAPRSGLSDGPLSSAVDFAALLAAFSVTSPHTIHPNADLSALLEFGGKLGVTFSDELEAKFL